jgi:hypothetical protein
MLDRLPKSLRMRFLSVKEYAMRSPSAQVAAQAAKMRRSDRKISK